MSGSVASLRAAPPTPDDAELLGYVLVFRRHRRLLAALVGASVLVTLATNLVMTRRYEATASVLVPVQTAGPLESLGAGGAASDEGLGLARLTPIPGREVAVGVLKSQRVARAAAERFDLRRRYGVADGERVAEKLDGAREVTVTDEGLVTVTIEDPDPALAAALANFHVEQLQALVADLTRERARQRRRFIAEQLARVQRDLAHAEERQRRFQERQGATLLSVQTEGAIEAAGRLREALVVAELELELKRTYATELNPEVVALRERVEALRRQLAKLEHGEAGRRRGRDAGRPEGELPIARLPAMAVDLGRLQRAVSQREAVVTMLAQQLERARLAEQQEALAVQVLDVAVPPARPTRPALVENLGLAAASSLFLGVFVIFGLDAWQRARAGGGGASG